MNDEYDIDRAQKLLHDIGLADSKAPCSSGMTRFEQAKLDDIRMVDIKYPTSTRMLEGEDEVVLRLQGVVCGKMLPPYTESPVGSKNISRIRNLRQHVKVTGLGTSAFAQHVEKLQAVHDKFSQHSQERTVLPFDFLPHEGQDSIESHSRYFTDRYLVPYEKNQPFLPGVDPFHVLRKLQPDDFIHAADNVVEYCIRATNTKGLPTYTPCDPSIFKVGDLVEVAFSCVGIPIKDQRMRIILQLRGLTLLDNTIRKESEHRNKMTMALAVVNVTPKRKRLYLSSEEVIPSTTQAAKKQRSEDTKATNSIELAQVPVTQGLHEDGEIIEHGPDGAFDEEGTQPAGAAVGLSDGEVPGTEEGSEGEVTLNEEGDEEEGAGSDGGDAELEEGEANSEVPGYEVFSEVPGYEVFGNEGEYMEGNVGYPGETMTFISGEDEGSGEAMNVDG